MSIFLFSIGAQRVKIFGIDSSSLLVAVPPTEGSAEKTVIIKVVYKSCHLYVPYLADTKKENGDYG